MTELKIQPENIEVNYIPLNLPILEGMVIGTTPQTNSPTIPPSDSNIVPSAGGSVMAGGVLQSPNFSLGVAGWIIRADGSVEFGTGKFRGDITGASGTFSGTITATTGTIGGWSISSAAIYYDGATDAVSSGMAPADYPFYAGKKYANRATAPFKVEPSGKLTVTDIVATGVINAQSGYLSAGVYVDTVNGLLCESGGLNVGVAGHIRGGQTDYFTGTGFFLGYSGAAYKLSIGNASDTSKLLLWDGTNLVVNDSIIAGQPIYGDGSDGDVTISANTTLTRDMYYNNLTVNSGITLSSGGYRIFVKNTLTNNGTIKNNGTNGVNGQPGAGTGGAGGSTGSLKGGTVGGNSLESAYGGGGGGGAGITFIAARIIVNTGTVSANGGNGGNGSANSQTGYSNYGQAGTSLDPGLGAAGAKGGDSRSSGGLTGASGGTLTAPTAAKGGFRTYPSCMLLREIESTTQTIGGGTGGGAGAQEISYGNGGGGGGGGGLVMILYTKLTDTGSITATAGTGGTGGNGGTNGTTGTDGSVIKLQF